MTKAELVDRICEHLGLSRKEGARLINYIFDSMKDSLSVGEMVKISGFGKFVVRAKKARRGRNPRDNSPLVISERRVLVFKPSQVLKMHLNPGGHDMVVSEDDDE
jgi:integration host factor subunit alpha